MHPFLVYHIFNDFKIEIIIYKIVIWYILDIFLVHGSRQKHTRLHTLCNFKTPSTYVPTYTIIELWPVNILFRQITMFLKVHVAFFLGARPFNQ